MQSFALLYNFSGKKAEMTKMICMMMAIKYKDVPVSDYHQPLGALLGLDGIERVDDVKENTPFAEEMLLLHGFDGAKLQKFLEALKRLGVGKIDLKAMLTETNKTWNAIELYAELCEEREAFRKMEEERKASKNKR